MLAELLDDLLVRAAVPARGTALQRHITDMLVAHRDIIEAQQRGDREAEVLAVRRMEAARSAVAGASPFRHRQTDTGVEQLEPFWCHEQSHDRPRCETQCAECAEDGVAEPSGEELSQAPSLDEILAVVQLYAKNPTPHNEYKVRCALRDALNLERQPQVRALMARAFEEGADAMERAAIEAVRERAPFDFHAHLVRQRAFSERTFGPGARTAGVLDHIRKELREIEEQPADLSEWIDVVILALDGAWRAGHSPEQIIETLVAKQAKNEARTWPDWRTAPLDRAIEHERSAQP
jgi:hypothetical protein